MTTPIPDNFRSTILDFTNDLSTTFSEYSYLWKKWTIPTTSDEEYKQLFEYCLTVYPERFFDILNQNADIFDVNGTINTAFLPNVEFKMLYHCQGVTDKTRQVMWKYLQLILFMMIGSVKDKMDFGDAMNMFNGIDENELHEKLNSTISSLGEFFSRLPGSSEGDTGSDPNMTNSFQDAFSFMESNSGATGAADSEENPKPRFPNMPRPQDLHDQIKRLFNGKIGNLAREIAEDIGDDLAQTLGDDLGDIKSTKDVFAKLMQNPQKIGGLVKTVGEKLNQKMTSGDLTQEDLMREAAEMMKGFGGGAGGEGMGGFADMFKTMAKNMGVNIPKGARMDTNAFTQMEKKMTAKDKLRARVQQKKEREAATKAAEAAKMAKQYEDYNRFIAANPNVFSTDDPTNFVFRIEGGEKQEKSTVPATTDNSVVGAIQPAKMSAGQKKRAKQKAKKASVASTNDKMEDS